MRRLQEENVLTLTGENLADAQQPSLATSRELARAPQRVLASMKGTR